MNNTLFGEKIIMSISFNESEIIKDILHLYSKNNQIDLDPTYSKGNFYKNEIKESEYKYDTNPQTKNTVKCLSDDLPHKNNSIYTIMFDPPFMIAPRESQRNGIIQKRFGYFESFDDLKNMYQNSMIEFYRILRKNGILIFKCQDTTDTKTYFTHCNIYNWAMEIGFKAKDLFIYLKKSRQITNGKQRHARKFHSYFWVFKK